MTRDRKTELLADRALEGLTDDEARLLEELGGAGDDSFDRAAAALALAELARTGDGEPLPEALAARVLASAPRPATGAVVDPATATGPAAARARARWSGRAALGWIAAAAAAVVAVVGWSRPPRVVEKVQVVEVVAPPPRPPTPQEARAALLASAADVKTIPWTATADADARGAQGDVVWSEELQQGYMRIRGLAANDPGSAQYQLWIFDGKRDAAHPVDGGVFDVQNGEVVVPIRAAVKVFEPRLFAVTVERPGGVVVSKRERIVLTAAL
ncbi:MAG TPA: anti-sigma factor [Anaeromyxobacteraceae bacterium]|nr:anti-sigma factor [Anaeromyxobacteraceae bacterium]